MYAYPNATPTSARTEGFVVTESVTPYELITKLNKYFAENNIEVKLPTQMGYNYGKKGMIDGIKRTSMKGVKFDPKKSTEWAANYIKKNISK
jgi:hypothetical protein